MFLNFSVKTGVFLHKVRNNTFLILLAINKWRRKSIIYENSHSIKLMWYSFIYSNISLLIYKIYNLTYFSIIQCKKTSEVCFSTFNRFNLRGFKHTCWLSTHNFLLRWLHFFTLYLKLRNKINCNSLKIMFYRCKWDFLFNFFMYLASA